MEASFSDGGTVSVRVEGTNNDTGIARRALAELARARTQLDEVRSEEPGPPLGIVGESACMQGLFELIRRVGPSEATALIMGENGTGKELVAKAIHALSSRRTKPFVATNCSAFNDNLLESELFGHQRGSFTGAVVDKPGLFAVADGGTFFLDEVGDMSAALQVKLLRVLQEGVFFPVGGTKPRAVDVRVIAATNRDLTKMLDEGTFREDLFYRLHVVAITVPPLRQRSDDIPLLVRHFLDRLERRDGHRKMITRGAIDRMQRYRWPGNVRELENEIERLWVLSSDEVIGEGNLSPALRALPPAPPPTAGGVSEGASARPGPPREPSAQLPANRAAQEPPATSLPEALEALERSMMLEALERAEGNRTRAARALGISRRNLIRKVQTYGLEAAGRAGESSPEPAGQT